MAKTKVKETTKLQNVAEEQKQKAIAEAAYYRWLNRGGGDGMDREDWLDAEQEIARNVFDRISDN